MTLSVVYQLESKGKQTCVLYDRARQYEATSFRGLFRFLRFIARILERGDDMGTARALGEQEDVVRIMTIHKSKDLSSQSYSSLDLVVVLIRKT